MTDAVPETGASGATPVQVRPIRASDWRRYRSTRLRALADAPDAFGSTFEAASRFTDAQWRARLEHLSPHHDAPLFALCDDAVAGLAWGRIAPQHPHTAELFQMWVDPASRGRGIGRLLVQTLVAWARRQGAVRMLLDVTVGNAPAEALYASIGFRAEGPTKPVRPGSTLMERQMVLELPQ